VTGRQRERLMQSGCRAAGTRARLLAWCSRKVTWAGSVATRHPPSVPSTYWRPVIHSRSRVGPA